MRIFKAIETSATGLTAERLRLDLIANNLANAGTTRTEKGGPYRRQVPVFRPRRRDSIGEGVRVVAIREDTRPLRLVYNPGHPDARPDGYVEMPNVDVITEMVDLISASRAYEANVSAINAAKAMATRALDIGRV